MGITGAVADQLLGGVVDGTRPGVEPKVEIVWIILADAVVAIHVGYVSFVVLGQLAILVGWWRRWGWVRNLWFRMAHMTAILIVTVEALITFRCPLTTLENSLRELGGQKGEDVDFIGRLFRGIIFVDIPDTHWVFKVLYFGFAVLVLATLILVPPRLRSAATAATARPREGDRPHPRPEPIREVSVRPGAAPPDPQHRPSRVP